jgi:hypothetical protein
MREYVHRDYFLVRSLNSGVAFHHGKMPQEVRDRIEQCFADPASKLQFIVCTSTLLEGVNLPAKNIFVLNDKHGPANFNKLDFENLAGRAGRLTYDFSGNVVCVRHTSARWSDKTRALVPRGKPIAAESFLVNPAKRRKKEYTDIGRVLRGEKLPGNPSVDATRSVQQYASILMLHYLDKQQTPLRTHFLERVSDGGRLLERVSAGFNGPVEVLRRSPGVLPKYQGEVWDALKRGEIGPLVSADANLTDYDIYEQLLIGLGDLYNWIKVESAGREALVPDSQPGYGIRLRYWALLMLTWVRGDPLSLVISTPSHTMFRADRFHMRTIPVAIVN